MSVPVTIRDGGASDKGRIVAGTAGFTIKDEGSQVLPTSFAKSEFLLWCSGRRTTSSGGQAGLGADHAQRKCDNTKIAWEGLMMRH